VAGAEFRLHAVRQRHALPMNPKPIRVCVTGAR
jgi:hypothetical protein